MRGLEQSCCLRLQARAALTLALAKPFDVLAA